jgi:hypothetical protein
MAVNRTNEQRTHSGQYGFGKTPRQTLIDSRQFALNRQLDQLYDDDSGSSSLETL